MSRTFYITTPIYYPNGEPHLGSLYATLCADAVARYHRLAGDDVFFLTGTDEHGIKMVKTAATEGMAPAALAEKNAAAFASTFAAWHVTNNDFIRTTQPRHTTRVQKIVEKLVASGDIYLGSYEGWYDEGQEEFVTEVNAKEQEYKSAISGRPLVKYAEPTYFFRLSKYAPQVLAHIEANPTFIQPDARRNKVLAELRRGAPDLSISRATLKWGIPMPNDPGHVLYVWIDALSNYVTALGYPGEDGGPVAGPKYWPADLHLIGKEILWFHAVYWPAMLIALELPLPRMLYAHGWWVADGRKMSKTMGNFIDIPHLDRLAETYSQDGVRYYLLRAAPFGSDLDFSHGDFTRAFDELANLPGNCLNRVIKMIGSYCEGVIPEATATEDVDRALLAEAEALPAKLGAAFEAVELQKAAMAGVELARAVNGYIEATTPFKLKDPSQHARRAALLGLQARVMATVFVALLPITPEKAERGLAQLGVAIAGKTFDQLFAEAKALAGNKVGEPAPLFPKPLPPQKK